MLLEMVTMKLARLVFTQKYLPRVYIINIVSTGILLLRFLFFLLLNLLVL